MISRQKVIDFKRSRTGHIALGRVYWHDGSTGSAGRAQVNADYEIISVPTKVLPTTNHQQAKQDR